jgi:hypothetical protein
MDRYKRCAHLQHAPEGSKTGLPRRVGRIAVGSGQYTDPRSARDVEEKSLGDSGAGVEFEYNVLAGSTWDAEIAKCVQYARDALA